MLLKEYLIATKTGQNDFAREIGLSKGAMSFIVNGVTALPSRRTLLAIKKATKGAVSLEDFLAEDTAA